MYNRTRNWKSTKQTIRTLENWLFSKMCTEISIEISLAFSKYAPKWRHFKLKFTRWNEIFFAIELCTGRNGFNVWLHVILIAFKWIDCEHSRHLGCAKYFHCEKGFNEIAMGDVAVFHRTFQHLSMTWSNFGKLKIAQDTRAHIVSLSTLHTSKLYWRN